MRVKFCLLTIVFILGCGGDVRNFEVVPKVISGSAVEGDAGSQVVKLELKYSDGSIGLCSGTVIAANAVLTASHCLLDTSSITIVANDRKISPSKIYSAPGFREDSSVNAIFNDLAILKTSEPIGLPALPILASRSPANNETVTIYGYGLDESGDFGALKSGEMILSSVTSNHLFADYTGKGSNACNGDSGGPATYSVTNEAGNSVGVAVAGIISSGLKEDCKPGDVTLFTNISDQNAINFILSVVPEVSIL